MERWIALAPTILRRMGKPSNGCSPLGFWPKPRNLTHHPPEDVRAIELAFKYKRDLAALGSLKEIRLKEGPSVGAVWTVCQVAKQLGIEKALGTHFTGKKGKLQIVIGAIV